MACPPLFFTLRKDECRGGVAVIRGKMSTFVGEAEADRRYWPGLIVL